MKKKLFVITVPRRLREGMKDIRYVVHGREEYITEPGIFPAVPVMEKVAADADEIRVVAVVTEDENGSSEKNLNELREKLDQISLRTGKPIVMAGVVRAANDENREKQVTLFRDICRSYEEDCEVYLDVTYGTKVTSLVMMSTLPYAEKLRDCQIKSVIYGNAFGKSEGDMMGDIYDVRCLYEFSMLMNCVDGLPKESAEKMIEQLWG